MFRIPRRYRPIGGNPGNLETKCVNVKIMILQRLVICAKYILSLLKVLVPSRALKGRCELTRKCVTEESFNCDRWWLAMNSSQKTTTF
jgi:hypothetical protein